MSLKDLFYCDLCSEKTHELFFYPKSNVSICEKCDKNEMCLNCLEKIKGDGLDFCEDCTEREDPKPREWEDLD